MNICQVNGPRRFIAMQRWAKTHGDRGSMLPLVIGMVVVATLLVTVVTDLGTMWLARRSLQATVDGAALAGSRSVDLAAIYAGRSRGPLLLDPAAAKSAVHSFVSVAPSARQLRAFNVTSVVIHGSTITVRAQATIRPPFIALLGNSDVRIVAQASAQTITN